MGAIDPSLACADPAQLSAAVGRELDPLVDRIDREGFYPGAALRALGARNAHAMRRRAPTGRGRLAAAQAAYERLRGAGGLPATFEVVSGAAFAGEPRTGH